MFPQIEEPLRSLDAEHHNQATFDFGTLKASFKFALSSQTVRTVLSKSLQGLSLDDAFSAYAEIRCADIGTPLDTHPLEDVYKAVKIISQYHEMTVSYARLLDASAFKVGDSVRYSDVLHGTSNIVELSRMVGVIAGLNHYGLLEKYCKWSTASLWAWSLRQSELPPTPDFMLHPILKDFLYLFPNKSWVAHFNCEAKFSRDNELFLVTFFKDLYNCKGAAAAVGPEFIEQALAKHKEILTTPKTAPTPIGEEAGTESDDSDRLLSAITQTAKAIFGYRLQKDNGLDRKAPSRFPSLNSSFNSRRIDGGAGAEILANSTDITSELYTLQPSEGYFYGFASHKSEVFEVRTPYDPEMWYEAEKESMNRALAKAGAGLGVDAQVIPLSEPFKVRTITKGDSDMYHLARRWQKVIHTKMRRFQSAALMGQPCSGDFLKSVFTANPWFNYNNKQGFFVSGDYESATDLLNPELSLWAQNEISNRLRIPLEHQRVLNACLTEHNLYYGQKDENGNKITHKQTWGQLMGSPTSFPVLCLINLAATKLAYEIYQAEQLKVDKVEIPLGELPMCVNGDDILFWCHSDRHYQIWKDVTANAGLKFSLGKNYTHRRFCIINSEMYHYRPDSPSQPFTKIACINTRLIEGGSRSEVTSAQPLDKKDIDALCKDKYFNREKHLPRFCRPNPKKTSQKSLEDHFASRDVKSEVWARYASWFNTIEQRRTVLKLQATETLNADYQCLSAVQKHRAKLMEEILDQRFSSVQMRRLNEFRVVLGEKLGMSKSYTMPQSLGGFGFPRRADTKRTGLDLKTSILEHLEPKLFKKCSAASTPKLAKAGFMKMAMDELNFVSKYIGVETVYEIKDYSSYKQVDDNSFFELAILSGFLSPTNLSIDIDEREGALLSMRNHAIPIQRLDPGLARVWNDLTKGAEKKQEFKKLCQDLEDGVERIELITLQNSEKGFCVRSYKPVPKLR